MGPPPAAPPPPGSSPPPPPAQVMEIEQRVKRVAMADTFLKLLLVAILGLMVWKPLGGSGRPARSIGL